MILGLEWDTGSEDGPNRVTTTRRESRAVGRKSSSSTSFQAERAKSTPRRSALLRLTRRAASFRQDRRLRGELRLRAKRGGFAGRIGQMPGRGRGTARSDTASTASRSWLVPSQEDFEPSPLFEAAGQLKLRFLAEKYAGAFMFSRLSAYHVFRTASQLPGSMEEARLFRSMPLVHRAFKNLAGHASRRQSCW